MGNSNKAVKTYHNFNVRQIPAFDHPLLKNHAILRRPSYHPEEGIIGENDAFDFEGHGEDDKITQLWQLNGRCPEGIRRHQNPSNLKRYAKKKHKNILQISPIDVKRAFAYVQGGKYFGTKAYLNLWKPQVQNQDFSSSQIWILGIPDAKVNSNEAGWMVLPNLNGDNTARPFTYWTVSHYI
ncbi:uncharacterized protein LOC113765484 [Coffea eugenioides]|uniref:uncharacterized protein LOC113765484 n=1 Tax=Coffea eugenioides TaxID=49369 RepID=UPI000F60C9A8|nr:uncharacterized protein LOC113765484 [Coffea eugenioides]